MEPTKIVYDACRNYLADSADTLGTLLTDRLLGAVRSRNLGSLTSASNLYDPVLHGREVLKVLLQVEAFFKKCRLFSSEDCSVAAMLSFRESERICKETNERLDSFFALEDQDPLALMIERMRREIDRVLGPREAFLGQLPDLVRVTNGATASHPRRSSGGAERLKRSMYATERSHPYLKSLAAFWGYTCNFRKIHHNRVELVPKNWKTHRTIACEPEGNIFLQLAFDAFCKRQLKTHLRVDLSDQSRNQSLALESSMHGDLCTVDLKAASDRLALNVVHLLFSREWVDFFLDTRSPCWKDENGDLVPYHKLSSMGNGYTFTVETLVFAAACRAVGSKSFSVYGDDIIIETELFKPLTELLAYLGFEVNEEKSHFSTPADLLSLSLARDTSWLGELPDIGPEFAFPDVPGEARSARQDVKSWLSNVLTTAMDMHERSSLGVYRESCGVHAHGGVVITPIFVRSLTGKRDMVLFANNMFAIGALGGNLWKFASSLVRELNLPLGPPVLDTGACVFIDVSTCRRLGLIRNFRGKHSFGPYQPAFRALVPRARIVRCFDSRALFLWFLHRKDRPYESSRYSLGTYKCRSKWVRYRPVMDGLVGGSVRLHWWTEMLLGREA